VTFQLGTPGRFLTVRKSGSGAGLVTSRPAGIFCGAQCRAVLEPGAPVTLTAEPDFASAFDGWTGPDCPGATFALESDVTCEAVFRRLPDLRVAALGGTSRAVPGSSIVVTDTVRNAITAGNAGASGTALFLSRDEKLDASDARLGIRPVPALHPGESSAGTSSVRVPPGTSLGAWFILAVADGSAAVPESSEVNNVRARAVVIDSAGRRGVDRVSVAPRP
jgi:hypothetical protein